MEALDDDDNDDDDDRVRLNYRIHRSHTLASPRMAVCSRLGEDWPRCSMR